MADHQRVVGTLLFEHILFLFFYKKQGELQYHHEYNMPNQNSLPLKSPPKKMATSFYKSHHDTVFLMTDQKYSYLSSSIVKQLAKLDGDITEYVTDYVKTKLKEKYNG